MLHIVGFTIYARYQIDKNAVERGQRLGVMGLKNYLFSKSESGAVDNAIYCSLLESSELAKVQPLQWQTHALENFRVEICYKERALLFGQGS